MLPPFLGTLLLLSAVAAVGLAIVVGVWAGASKRPLLARRSSFFGGSAATVYGGSWILGLVLSGPSEVFPGDSICFGGLDCHLQVSVSEVRQGKGARVLVKFASNAVRAPEWPGALRFRLRDAAGKLYTPTNSVPDAPLGAGETRFHELQFPEGVTPAGSALIVTWKPGLDYFVPGSGNPLVQVRRRLTLPAPSPSGA